MKRPRGRRNPATPNHQAEPNSAWLDTATSLARAAATGARDRSPVLAVAPTHRRRPRSRKPSLTHRRRQVARTEGTYDPRFATHLQRRAASIHGKAYHGIGAGLVLNGETDHGALGIFAEDAAGPGARL